MIEPSAVSPLLYDASDVSITVELGVAHGSWVIDSNVRYAIVDDRLVPLADQSAFPGR